MRAELTHGSVFEYAADLNGDSVMDTFDLNMIKVVVLTSYQP